MLLLEIGRTISRLSLAIIAIGDDHLLHSPVTSGIQTSFD
jgi:hypothetical protein